MDSRWLINLKFSTSKIWSNGRRWILRSISEKQNEDVATCDVNFKYSVTTLALVVHTQKDSKMWKCQISPTFYLRNFDWIYLHKKKNSLCRPDWPRNRRDPVTSSFLVLGLKGYDITLSKTMHYFKFKL